MKMIAIILFAAVAVPAVFSSEIQYPSDNASEIVPPHSQRGHTYAKGDPLDRIIHGTDPARVYRNEVSAGEYRPGGYTPTREVRAYACDRCEYRRDYYAYERNGEVVHEVRYDDDSPRVRTERKYHEYK
jgi:hypothetical protein